jgi:Mannosylglycerate hydrolase MGH1-like glycoside hydrolase domain
MATTRRIKGRRTAAAPGAERHRLDEARDGVPWRRWGPYLAERAWGTVREDYSAGGNAWGSFTHDDARRRTYRWNEDGLLGVSDDEQRLCLALCLWNERDPILKERPFGLSNPEGNHGEDVKELYFYLDAVPSSAYLRAAYLYPQAAFPYSDLVTENARRDGFEPEYELLDTGVLDDDRFFDVVVEYAKAAPDEVLMRIRATNLGPDPAPLHLMPTAWFRNTWSWDAAAAGGRPSLSLEGGDVAVVHSTLGRYRLAARADGADARWLFTENESTGGPVAFTKDAFHRLLVDDEADAVNPGATGTKAAFDARGMVASGATFEVLLAMAPEGDTMTPARLLDRAAALIELRRAEADEFHAGLVWPTTTAGERLVHRQALAGVLWSMQYYAYDVARWRSGDSIPPPAGHATSRNRDWGHLRVGRVLSMPDTWEYPWFAAWDLAFQAVVLDLADPDRAREQLLALLDDDLLHPSGQLPAFEWEFSDANPPVQAWAALRIYRRERTITGRGDRAFLERMLHGLALNFGWWVNRRDRDGQNLFEGGFLGLDNISIVDRSAVEASGEELEQADATGWMALLALGLTEMALELAVDDPVYVELAKHFLGRFIAIGEALAAVGGEGLWDADAEFFFDLLRPPGQAPVRLRAFSIAGLVPLFAARVLDPDLLAAVPGFASHLERMAQEHPAFFAGGEGLDTARGSGRRLLAIVGGHRLVPILRRLLDDDMFWSDHGVRSVSRDPGGQDLPPGVAPDGGARRVEYEPGETQTRLKGGNSNWRGPVWLPVNYLLWYGLRQFARYYGDALPAIGLAPDGRPPDLRAVSDDLARRLVSLYVPGPDGLRPAQGPDPRWRDHQAFRDRLLFYEYFHGDSGMGLGASHQTGWTALLANLIDGLHRPMAGAPR